MFTLSHGVWSGVGLVYLAFLFVHTAANPSLSFHFPSFNTEPYLSVSTSVIKYLRWRRGCLTSNTRSLFFILLQGILGPSFLEESILSLCLSLSFHLAQGAFDVICPCLHIILLQNESENLCLLCMKTILLEPFSSQVQCVLRISQTRLNYECGRHVFFLLPFRKALIKRQRACTASCIRVGYNIHPKWHLKNLCSIKKPAGEQES